MNPSIIGESRQIREIRELIHNVADTGLNILITGETGVGKGIVANKLHDASPRKNNPFVTVNCAALPETLLESELYGYSKGAFTGAQKSRKGKFQLAHKGVLFLDEIGDMPISLQPKILHVLQAGAFAPLGADQEIITDVWLIVATNHDLEVKITNKTFREDLYYRLNIIKIHIPPLRERSEDIPLLVNYYVNLYAEQYPSRNIQEPDREILNQLTCFSWPGNVRQLQNIIKKQIVVNNWDLIVEELKQSEQMQITRKTMQNRRINDGKKGGWGEYRGTDQYLESVETQFRENDLQYADFIPNSLLKEFVRHSQDFEKNIDTFELKKIKHKAIQRVEREVIGYVLDKSGWNRAKASKVLKISYKTLLTKINELKLIAPDTH